MHVYDKRLCDKFLYILKIVINIFTKKFKVLERSQMFNLGNIN